MSNPVELVIRRADRTEAEAAVGVIIESRHASVPAIPAPVHPDHEIRAWFRDIVMASNEVWVALDSGEIVGTMVLAPGWIEQLYVAPKSTGLGIGAALLRRAMSEASGPLDLWTFASNDGAQRFYLRHGFVEQERTNGDNEEGAPDIRYRWVAPQPPADQR